MTDDQINKGLSAFDDGASNWNDCFWARVFKEEKDLSMVREYTNKKGERHQNSFAIEWWIADRLNLPSNIPVRCVYQLFDNCNSWMKREDLAAFIRKARTDERASDAVENFLAVEELIAGLPKETFEKAPSMSCFVG